MRIFSKNRNRLVLELLAALAVIAIVAAILSPVVTIDKGPHKSICITRLKNLSTVILMYSSDNHDDLPPTYTFDGPGATQKLIDITFVYSKNQDVYLCPQDSSPIQPNQEGLTYKMSFVNSLALRGIIPEFSTGKRLLRQSDVEEVAMTPFLRDPIRGYGSTEPNSKATKPQFMSPHGTRFSIGYMDGHVKAKSPIDEFKEL